MKKLLLLLPLALALPIAADASRPEVKLDPLYPRSGNWMTVSWSQSVPPGLYFSFSPATFSITPPPFPGGPVSYGGPHVVTVSKSYLASGDVGSQYRDSISFPVEAGTYSVVLQLFAGGSEGPKTETFLLGEFTVTGPCFPSPAVTTLYSSETRGYKLHCEDLINGYAGLNGPPSLSIAGNRIDVHQSVTIGDAAPIAPTCIAQTLDVGELPPGTYQLRWTFDTYYVGGPYTPAQSTRELTFEIVAPKRRTSRR